MVRTLVGIDRDRHLGDPTVFEVKPGRLLLGNHDRQDLDAQAMKLGLMPRQLDELTATEGSVECAEQPEQQRASALIVVQRNSSVSIGPGQGEAWGAVATGQRRQGPRGHLEQLLAGRCRPFRPWLVG